MDKMIVVAIMMVALHACNPTKQGTARYEMRTNGHSSPVEKTTVIDLPDISDTPTLSEASSNDFLSGTISIADHLKEKARQTEVLYVIVKGPSGPPLAVKRMEAPSFPIQFMISSNDMMTGEGRLSGQVTLKARLDRDGVAGPASSGDMEGITPSISVGSKDITILINKLY